jgi:uncharacterized protein involved in oxidation of intracellular sulfur
MSKLLMIFNDPPYGTERCFNGLRLALNLLKMDKDLELTVFLIGDSILCAKSGQSTPNGYYNLGRMLKSVIQKGEVLLCGTCMDARGIKDEELVGGCKRSNLDELTRHTLEADKVIVF